MNVQTEEIADDQGEGIVMGRSSFYDSSSDDEDIDDEGVDMATHATGLGNAYIEALSTDSGLILLQDAAVRRAYSNGGEVGLFSLFFTGIFKDSIRGWTNAVLEDSGAEQMSANEFDAYLGLEMAMSITAINEISDFWSSKRFLGCDNFTETMSRTRFQQLRSHLKIHRANVATQAEMENDPLWHCRTILNQVQTKFAEIAVPFGVSSLDENSIRTKARTKAKSYIPSKPDKYALRFYAVVGWKSLYIHSIWDNGSGNTTETTPPDRYTAVFPALRTPLANTLRLPGNMVAAGSPTALWVAMMGHQTRVRVSPSGRRLMVSDNFYTRHNLADALRRFTDNETRLLGTCRLNLVDKWNKVELNRAVERVGKLPRGSWELVAAVKPTPGWEECQAKHNSRQRRLPKDSRTAYIGPVTIVPNAGFVVFLDKKIVTFYTNDLRETVPARSLPGSDARAANCCHGLYPIRRWTGSEMLNRRTFMVPAIIGAYNLAMNAVDRVDQLRSTNPTRRKEVRLSMSVFTWALDMCVINAYALYRHIKPHDVREVKLREFKRRIADALTMPLLNARRKAKRKPATSLTRSVGVDTSHHILTPNSTERSGGQLLCMLCSMRGKRLRTRWGCTECGRGFHVECYAAFHFRDVFTAATPSVRAALDIVASAAAGEAPYKTRRRQNESITPLCKLTLPEEK